MTAPAKVVYNRRGEPITADDPCPCQIYEIWGIDPWRRGQGLVCLRVGESARRLLVRVAEYADEYWAADVRLVKLRPEVYPTKGAVWEVEEQLIHELQPVHNWEYNQDNPWAVWNGRGVHKPLPATPVHWSLPSGAAATGPARPGLAGWWRPVRSWVIGVPIGWLVATLLLWWAQVRLSDAQPRVAAQNGAALAGLLAAAVVGVRLRLWVKDWQARRRRERTRRRARERRQARRR